ncbi:MAG TPA: hypothetical protein PLP42_22680, partial [Acidobacteriota bacterium]|nr:hypothetical protein [Acidobacteriota bacterium]
MFEKVSCFILILCIALIPLSAESLSTFLQRLPSDSDAGFQAAKLQDLSVYQTWSKPLPHVIPCRAFTFVAAIEAAYTRKYCEDPNSSYYKAGYCERYAALKAANLPTFRLAHPNYQNFAKDKKALDLSELYFYDRVTTSWTTSSDSKHETGQPFCQVKTNKRVCESASLLLSEIRLPEEQYAEYIYDEGFFSDVRSNVFNACGAQGNTPTQEQVDQYSFSESKFDIKTSDNKPQQRAFIPFEARRHAQFGVDNAVVGSFDAVSDKIKFVEKCIYRNYEVAVHLKSGHSLLVIGYDRDGKKFLIKDHNQQFAVMEYAAVVDSMSTFDIVVEPAIDWSYPSLEEMWLGSWDVLVDGEYGKLVIRRTRRAPNITLEDNDLLNNDIAPLSTTQWARVGSFYGGTSDQHAVWGRLNNSNGKTIELIVNFDVPEPPPPSTIPIATPKGQLFKLRLFRLGGSSCVAVYATGETEKNGSLCPVLLKRPGQNPLGLIPRSPASVYLKERWKGRFHLWGDGAQTGVLELTSSDSMQTLTGSLRVDDAYDCVVTGSLVDDSHAKLTANYAGVEQIELDLFYHR